LALWRKKTSSLFRIQKSTYSSAAAQGDENTENGGKTVNYCRICKLPTFLSMYLNIKTSTKILKEVTVWHLKIEN